MVVAEDEAGVDSQIAEHRDRVRLSLASGSVEYEQRMLVAGREEAPPLVLAHGIAGSADEWIGVMPALAARFRVLAPDAPGHGFSEKPAQLAYELAVYEAATRQLLESVGGGGAVPLVALSGAGTVAISIALSRPALISRLVLVDAAGIGPEVSWDYRLASLPGAPLFFRRMLTARSIERYGRRLVFQPDRLPAGWVERRMRIWQTTNAIDAFFRTARLVLSLRGQRTFFGDRLHQVRHPTLILWGENDPIIPVAHGHYAARRMPNARLRVFARCGHVPPWEYPEEFVAEVLGFLADG